MQGQPWYKSLGRTIWWITRYVWAPFMAVAVPILALYGAVLPREPDFDALQLRSAQIPVLIGIAGNDTACVDSGPCEFSSRRLYMVFPQALTSGEIAVVSHTNLGRTVDRKPLAAYLFLAIWGTCVFLTWRHCVYPLLQASNNRLERSRDASSLGQGGDR